ncbi:capsule biosynthesis GfcC family protein [Vibrio intestinalis]|uniref:capsule biosynthesis GfcC family protein n=1 Tax=Vibrio intestinalis TaxID=2933291 RepID=UPI0021A3D409|nr:capsule biosynthesis GfcC family protein [Vibrio intestinalis]
MLKTIILSGSLLFFSSLSFANSISIEIHPNTKVISFDHPIRLETAISESLDAKLPVSPQSYSIANALYNKDKQYLADKKQREVINELKLLYATSPKLRMSAAILIAQIERWQVGYRETVNLDYDAVRTTPALNPMLTGNYLFKFTPRPSHIHIEGLVSNPHTTLAIPNYTVSDYLDEAALTLSSGENSNAWVVYPDGKLSKVGFEYWNNQHALLPPGASIYIGFDSPSEELAKLEQDILTLIAWRISK